MKYYRMILLALIVGLTGGCASIPKESPELSREIGNRIVEMRSAHLELVHEYFEMKRERVSRIFEEAWIPAYAESFFGQEQVADYWDQLVTGDDKTERVRFLTRLGPKMLAEIQSRRAEYLQPLDRLESSIEVRLREDYRQILSANHTLTSFLASSSSVVQNRDRYLELVGVQQDRVESYVSKIDQRSDEIMEEIRSATINN